MGTRGVQGAYLFIHQSLESSERSIGSVGLDGGPILMCIQTNVLIVAIRSGSYPRSEQKIHSLALSGLYCVSISRHSIHRADPDTLSL